MYFEFFTFSPINLTSDFVVFTLGNTKCKSFIFCFEVLSLKSHYRCLHGGSSSLIIVKLLTRRLPSSTRGDLGFLKFLNADFNLLTTASLFASDSEDSNSDPADDTTLFSQLRLINPRHHSHHPSRKLLTRERMRLRTRRSQARSSRMNCDHCPSDSIRRSRTLHDSAARSAMRRLRRRRSSQPSRIGRG